MKEVHFARTNDHVDNVLRRRERENIYQCTNSRIDVVGVLHLPIEDLDEESVETCPESLWEEQYRDCTRRYNTRVYRPIVCLHDEWQEVFESPIETRNSTFEF